MNKNIKYDKEIVIFLDEKSRSVEIFQRWDYFMMKLGRNDWIKLFNKKKYNRWCSYKKKFNARMKVEALKYIRNYFPEEDFDSYLFTDVKKDFRHNIKSITLRLKYADNNTNHQ